MADWRDYLKLMESLAQTLEKLTAIEREKNAAASRGDLQGVEDCMKREQAMSLTLRGYDQKRDSLLAGMGLTGMKLSQMEQSSPEELRLETKAVAERLRQQYELFRVASDVARDTLEVNLRAIEQIQNRQAGDSAEADETRKNHQTDFRA